MTTPADTHAEERKELAEHIKTRFPAPALTMWPAVIISTAVGASIVLTLLADPVTAPGLITTVATIITASVIVPMSIARNRKAVAEYSRDGNNARMLLSVIGTHALDAPDKSVDVGFTCADGRVFATHINGETHITLRKFE